MRNAALAIGCLVVALIFRSATLALADEKISASVDIMGPLLVGPEHGAVSWERFGRLLAIPKDSGARGITTDVWWGDVEKQKGHFGWGRYRQIGRRVRETGIKWSPILATHACRESLDDTAFHIDVIPWMWNSVPGLTAQDLAYKSEIGQYNYDAITPWTAPLIHNYIRRFIEKFGEEFGEFAPIIPTIYIGVGPQGELRYPSYGPHDHWTFPEHGYFQAYSSLAAQAFRQWLRKKYQNDISKLQAAWNDRRIKSFDHVEPLDGRPDWIDRFYEDRAGNQAASDFIQFNQESLFDFVRWMFLTAAETYNQPGHPFRGIPLGIKVPNLHWQATRPRLRRLTEMKAGLIANDIDYSNPDLSQGYPNLIWFLSDLRRLLREKGTDLIVTFTGVELSDGHGGQLAHSAPKTLMQVFLAQALANGLSVTGENALHWSLYDPMAWENTAEALRLGLKGMTFLRLDYFETPEVQDRFRDLMRSVIVPSGSDVTACDSGLSQLSGKKPGS